MQASAAPTNDEAVLLARRLVGAALACTLAATLPFVSLILNYAPNRCKKLATVRMPL